MAAQRKTQQPRPLASMTGFGRGSVHGERLSVEFEVRTVNGKGLFLKLRMPNERLELEPKLEARIRKRLERGNLHGSLRVRVLHQVGASIDPTVLAHYLKDWRSTAEALGLPHQDPSLAELIQLPGALEQVTESTNLTKAVEKAVLAAADQALEALIAARCKEGERLRKELLNMVGSLEKLLVRTRKRLPKALEAAGQKLKERVEHAWESAGIQEPLDLARELAVIADKADVQEEVARAEIHLERLRALLERGGPCGRELEFLVQELHREVTTLGNKSADASLSEMVVAMKTEVQRLKEQVANVE